MCSTQKHIKCRCLFLQSLERETSDISLEEEFILAKIFTPLVELEPTELLQELDRLQERKPRIPDIALYAIIQIRVGMSKLLQELSPEKQILKNHPILLRAAFRIVMKNKVSSVLKKPRTNSLFGESQDYHSNH